MRHTARSIVNLLTLASILSGPLAVAAEPTSVEAHTPLTAVSKREAYIFASTPDGLFRAPLATKRWERLKTPPEMPPDGKFASQPARSSLIIYVVLRSQTEKPPRQGLRYGLYLSHDDGTTWKLVSERNDFGAVLHHPSGALFAVTGDDGINRGDRLLRSPDLGKTWRDITGTASGQFMGLEPDPDHPGLVRIHAWAFRDYTFVAEDERYQWKSTRGEKPAAGRRASDDFFSRVSSSSNRFYLYPATLANFFQHDFGNRRDVHALEVVPLKTRYEFARGVRVIVPIRVVFHFDSETLWPERRMAVEEGRPFPKPTPPSEKFVDQPGVTDFWGLRVESADSQTETYPPGPPAAIAGVSNAEGNVVTKRSQPPAVKYKLFNLSPSSPYERELDLSHLADFSKPGEYHVQILYNSGSHPEGDDTVWDGSFTSPVFTVVIRP